MFLKAVALCFVSFQCALSLFPLRYHAKNLTLGPSHAIAPECLLEIPWIKPVWKHSKGNLLKIPLLFYSLPNKRIQACDNELGA